MSLCFLMDCFKRWRIIEGLPTVYQNIRDKSPDMMFFFQYFKILDTIINYAER